MSGIVGMANSEGMPVDSNLLNRMTKWLSFCGPDAQEIRVDGPVGLGHALLSHANESAREHQPATIDGCTWATADVRLDARRELVEALRSRGREANLSDVDVQLLLQSYEAWGEGCVDHLLGDFAFAIWDAREHQIFCASDHFGIKPLYFAQVGHSLIFSNTLDCVRLHPGISDRLNDAAIADFLLFGLNYDPASTSFADIRRLPRAHTLQWSRSGLKLREYWRPPTDGVIAYRRRQEYVEHFNELFGSAVEDRLRTNQVGVLLSGGLDSSSVTAVAHELRERKYPQLELHAFTSVRQSLSCEGDAQAARIVTSAFQLPLHLLVIDRLGIFEGWDDPNMHWPEPVAEPFAANFRDEFKAIAANARVLLSGEGSDNLMEFEMAQHLRRLWRDGRMGQAVADLAEHVLHRFQAPDGLRGPLRRVGHLFSRRESNTAFPEWIQPELASRLNLKSRWNNPVGNLPWNAHPDHPVGYGSLFLSEWDVMFRRQSAATTRQPVEVRYPFLDVRLVNFLLAIPSMPWFFRKHLLRETMRGRLPESIRLRPKTPFTLGSLVAALQRDGSKSIPKMQPASQLSHYIRESRLPSLERLTSASEAELRIRPACLNFWLHSLPRKCGIDGN
ncbi:MAG TPA: asparagine synthase-related protein [Candidatus Acidoferrales bacterium]|nr:asparagine synthase-related protein [Candidatus Acidoferrales bacterium]